MLIIIILLHFLCLAYGILLWYYRKGWMMLPYYKPSKHNFQYPFISVIVAARNEEFTLPNLLTGLLAQTYPENSFEVIIINDHSTDGTAEVVKTFARNIKLVNLSDTLRNSINSYKKKAIETGIAQSRGEIIVTTDADCHISPDWLITIANFYKDHNPDMIIMPVEIISYGKLLHKFQQLDFMSLQGITGGSVQKKLHSMCNGANLSYTRASFYAVNGFDGIDQIASGDDMLLMQKMLNKNPEAVGYLKSRDVIVRTKAEDTFSAFFQQRIRWASKSGRYSEPGLIAILILVYLVNLSFLVSPFMLLFSSMNATTFLLNWLAGLTFKIIMEVYFLFPVSRFYEKEKSLLLFPFFQPFHIIYIVLCGFLGMAGSYKWKGRKVK